MATITEDYVSFEVAKLLKEKGFDEKLQHYYDTDGILVWCHRGQYFSNKSNAFIAPTQAMAMKWLREVHNIHIVPMIENNGNYIGHLYDTKGNNVQGWDRRLSKTSYEEACEAAIKYCLENLI